MKVTRIRKAPDGGSQFCDFEIRLEPTSYADSSGRTAHLSKFFPATEWAVGEVPEGLNLDWHPAPQRQLATVLEGVFEVETSDGERRVWRSGEMFLADDSGSRGHRTRAVGGTVRLLFLRFPDQVVWGDQNSSRATDPNI
jgi:hypothetical protein